MGRHINRKQLCKERRIQRDLMRDHKEYFKGQDLEDWWKHTERFDGLL